MSNAKTFEDWLNIARSLTVERPLGTVSEEELKTLLFNQRFPEIGTLEATITTLQEASEKILLFYKVNCCAKNLWLWLFDVALRNLNRQTETMAIPPRSFAKTLLVDGTTAHWRASYGLENTQQAIALFQNRLKAFEENWASEAFPSD